FSSPKICTTVARVAIRRTKVSASRRRIPKPPDQSRPCKDFDDFAELRKRCDNAELVMAPRGDDFAGRSVGLEESGDPDVGVKQGDERHGVSLSLRPSLQSLPPRRLSVESFLYEPSFYEADVQTPSATALPSTN